MAFGNNKKSCIRETLNLSTCVDSITESGVMCHVLRVTCHLSPANNHSQGPIPCKLPQYEQQDAAADLDLDPSVLSRKGLPKIYSARQFFTISEPRLQLLRPMYLTFSPYESFCNRLMLLLTFVNGSIKTLDKIKCVKMHCCNL